MAGESLQHALELLKTTAATPVTEAALERLQTHLALIRQWNPMAGLVSNGDVAFLEERHLVDALSLIPYIEKRCGTDGVLLDIGSGGGFPAIPIKCVLPGLRLVLIERSTRKIGFLQRTIATLQFEGVDVVHGGFPEALSKIEASCITARAVERPRQMVPAILKRMPRECAFLCQSDVLPPTGQKTFHVEHVQDPWRQSALRRGELYIITHRKRR